MSKNNGGGMLEKSTVTDPVIRRVLTEVAAMLQCQESLKITINKSGGADRRVKIEVTRYIEVGVSS